MLGLSVSVLTTTRVQDESSFARENLDSPWTHVGLTLDSGRANPGQIAGEPVYRASREGCTIAVAGVMEFTKKPPAAAWFTTTGGNEGQ